MIPDIEFEGALRRYTKGEAGYHDMEKLAGVAVELLDSDPPTQEMIDFIAPLVGAKIEAKVDIPFKTKGQVRCFLIGLGYNRNFIP